MHQRAQPNAGHLAIAQLENALDDFTLATQNVEVLHLRAGLRNVLELHGSLREARCTLQRSRPFGAAGLPLDQIEHACGGRGVPNRLVWRIAASRCLAKSAGSRVKADAILVVGTSAVVYPAAALATHYNKAAFVVEINPEETAISGRVDIAIRANAAEALPMIVNACYHRTT